MAAIQGGLLLGFGHCPSTQVQTVGAHLFVSTLLVSRPSWQQQQQQQRPPTCSARCAVVLVLLQEQRFGEVLQCCTEGLDPESMKKAVRKSRVMYNRGGADEPAPVEEGKLSCRGMACLAAQLLLAHSCGRGPSQAVACCKTPGKERETASWAPAAAAAAAKQAIRTHSSRYPQPLLTTALPLRLPAPLPSPPPLLPPRCPCQVLARPDPPGA